MDPPHPVGGETVHVLTVHQAKGLEFPIVVLWDACASWSERPQNDAWTVERDGRGWALRLDDLRWEEPPGLGIEQRERRRREAERKRLVYVAATRARDILVIPKTDRGDDAIWGRVLGTEAHPAVVETPSYSTDNPPPWFDDAAPSARNAASITDLASEIGRVWRQRASDSTRAALRPRAFAAVGQFDGGRERFGSIFGTVVHLAIGHAIRGMAVGDAVRQAAGATRSFDRIADAAHDVERVLATLRELGITREACTLEYPVAGAADDGDLLAGYIDLVAITPTGVIVLDFKTDTPPLDDEAVRDGHVRQVTGYANVVAGAMGSASVRAGILYTATGAIRWTAEISPLEGEAETR
jgi:ATP-dependent exoDNAse (exonuclease V) beta subunit